jgi:glutaredoxin-like protein NrdH
LPRVTIYTLPHCVQCDRTKKLMDREGVAYDVVKLEEHPEQLAAFKEEGLLQAPIVVVGNNGRRWAGFRPDLIKELAPVAAVEGQ